MTVYRGITIKCEKTGSYTLGAKPISIKHYKATVNDKSVKGTLDEVKKKIDEELGGDNSDNPNTD